jgi:membrane associated rhomboid family serine protease
MYSLYIFGPMLERMLGRGRYLALYLLAGFGGSVAVLLLAPLSAVLGASGAIFGLMAAFFVIQRHLGGRNVQLLVVIGLNLVSGFFISSIAWQAHVGGLVVGALIALIYTRTRNRRQHRTQVALVTGVGVLLVAVVLVRFLV